MELPQDWRVIISNVGEGFHVKVFIFRQLEGNRLEVLYPGAEGEPSTTKIIEAQHDFPASLSFNIRIGAQILRSFAEALAVQGFTTLDSGAMTKAKDMHIASLEKESERMFQLALRNPIVVKESV